MTHNLDSSSFGLFMRDSTSSNYGSIFDDDKCALGLLGDDIYQIGRAHV